MTMDSIRPLSVKQLEALHASLNPTRVKTRSGMSYLEAWDVKASLIKVFGYGGFSAECLDAKIIRDEQVKASSSDKMNWAVSAQASVRLTIPQLGVVYTESAIATNKQPDWGEAADTALKSAESDALKRAAIYLGTQFGLSLYKDGSTANVVSAVRAPDQIEIVDDLNLARAQSAESTGALARLQARMKVEKPEEQPTPAPAAQEQGTTAQDAVERSMENAEREAAKIEDAQQRATPAPRTTRKTPAKKAAPRKTTRTLTSSESVSADRQAVARNALANAERTVGLGDPNDPSYGPGAPDYVMDDEHQMREDAL